MRLTICSADGHLPPALRQHRGPLDTRRQHHGLGLGRHFLFLLAKDAGEHLPLCRGGAALGAHGDAHFRMLHGAAAGMNRCRWLRFGGLVSVFLGSFSPSSPLSSRDSLSLCPALWYVVIKHLVGLDEVFLHSRHLGHYLLAVEFGRLSFPFTLGFLFVLSTLE